MFNNIGSKIKGLAAAIAVIGIVLSVMAGLLLMMIDGGFIVGLIVALFGSVSSWLGTLMLYGFGSAVDDLSAIRRIAESSAYKHGTAPQRDDTWYEEVLYSVQRDDGATPSVGVGTCSFCGAQVKEGNRYCMNCGSEL